MGRIDKDVLRKLSERELKLLDLLAQGLNTSQISKLLSMRYRSVAEIILSIKQKLKLASLDEIRNLDPGQLRLDD
jgi:DNA-binding NarL/FixJ family response regulator